MMDGIARVADARRIVAAVEPAPRPVRLLERRLLRGCNRYHAHSVLCQRIDLGDMAGRTSAAFGPALARRYEARFAALDMLPAARVATRRFAERLADGHAVRVERLLFEAILAVDRWLAFTMRRFEAATHAEIVAGPRAGIVDLVWSCPEPALRRDVVRVALAGLKELLPEHCIDVGPATPFRRQLATLERRARRRQWSIGAALVADAAGRRGIPCETMGGAYLRLGQGTRQRVVYGDTALVPAPAPAAGQPSGASARCAARMRDGTARYRVLLAGGRFVAATRIDPPVIAGDGRRTIAELLDALNDDPWRDGLVLERLDVAVALDFLTAQGRRAGDVMAAGDRVVLRFADDIASGGVSEGVTGRVHPDNRRLAEHVVATAGLDVAGVDLEMRDIARSCRETTATASNLTAVPDILLHAMPRHGNAVDVGDALLERLLADAAVARVPVAIVAGARGAARVARELDGLLRAGGARPGLATRRRTTFAGARVATGSRGLRDPARFLLGDPRVEAVIATTSPSRLLRRGLRVDRCTVSALLESGSGSAARRDAADVLLRATSGALVVDADSPATTAALRRAGSARVVVAAGARHARLMQLLAAGCAAVYPLERADGACICIQLVGGAAPLPVARVRRGTAARDVLARVHAIALAHGLGLTAGDIATASGRRWLDGQVEP